MLTINIRRFFAAIIDFYIICFVSSLVIMIVTLGKMNVSTITITLYMIVFVFSLLLKDFLFKNASIGKKIFRIKVEKNDGTKLTFIDSFKRTIPLLLLPIEVFLLLIKNNRIGDKWANTIVNIQN